MEQTYHDTKKLLDAIQRKFSSLEVSNEATAVVVSGEITEAIREVFRNCEKLDILVNKEPPSRRQNAKYQLDQLKYDGRHMEASLNGVMNRRASRDREQRERSDLLQRKFTTNANMASESADQATIDMDRAVGHNSSLAGANKNLDIMLDSGGAILGSIREQGGVLKSAHNKMLNALNVLGLSNTVMRLTERRAASDRLLLFGGMILTCVFMFLLVIYVR